MKKISWVNFLFFLLIFIQLFDIQAQNFKKNIHFDWQEPLSFHPSEENEVRLLYFRGAISADGYESLPQYFERFATDAFYGSYEVTLSDVQSARMTADEAALVPAGFAEESFRATARTVVDRKKNYAALSILPVRKNGNGYEK